MMLLLLTAGSVLLSCFLFHANRDKRNPAVTALAILVGGPLVWLCFLVLMVANTLQRTVTPSSEWDREAHRLMGRVLADHLLDRGQTVLRPDDEAALVKLLGARKDLYAFGDPQPCTISTDAPKTRDT